MSRLKLTFIQESDSKRGTCKCVFLDNVIDHCDMNYDMKYTQAHIVLASVWHTLKHKDVSIEVIAADNSATVYPVEDIIEMANYSIDENFMPTHAPLRDYQFKVVEKKDIDFSKINLEDEEI